MKDPTVILWIIGILLGVIGFFLIRLVNSHDKMQGDVRKLLINGATRDEKLDNVIKDVEQLQLSFDRLKKA
jgi:uncharacterized membrane-anchored protein YhcB (DUF1043 family)